MLQPLRRPRPPAPMPWTGEGPPPEERARDVAAGTSAEASRLLEDTGELGRPARIISYTSPRDLEQLIRRKNAAAGISAALVLFSIGWVVRWMFAPPAVTASSEDLVSQVLRAGGGPIKLQGKQDLVVSVCAEGDGPFHDGVGVHLYQDVLAKSQEWLVEDGYIKLATKPNLVLSVDAKGEGPFKHGTGVRLSTNVHSDAQRWAVHGGEVALLSQPKLVLTAVPLHGKIQNEAPLEVRHGTERKSQRWSLQAALAGDGRPSAADNKTRKGAEGSRDHARGGPHPARHHHHRHSDAAPHVRHEGLYVKGRLTAYWDLGDCGPNGDDHHADWCGGAAGAADCKEVQPVERELCPTGHARLASVKQAHVNGPLGLGGVTPVVIDDCQYMFFAQYECVATTTTTTTTTTHTTTTTTTRTTTSTTITTTTTTVETEEQFREQAKESTSAADVRQTFGPIRHQGNLCLAVQGAGRAGDEARLSLCGEGGHRGEWKYDAAIGQIRSRLGVCLAGLSAAGVSLRTCDGHDKAQHWHFGDAGPLRNSEGLCLQAPEGAAGSAVQVEPCKPVGSQHWRVEQAACKQLKSRKGGKCLDAPGRCESHGAVHLWDCLRDVANQQWEYDGKSRQIKNHHGVCLATSHDDKPHAHVFMYRCDPFMFNQKWEYDAKTGHVKSHHGKCLASPHPDQNGAPLSLVDCHDGQENQGWDLLAGSCEAKDNPHFCSVCDDRFRPPAPGRFATHLNGVRIADTCFEDGGNNGIHKVFHIGDWGGLLGKKGPVPADHRRKDLFPAVHRPFIVGVDDQAQQRVAHQMALRARTSHPDYILNAGDNFYWGGINDQCGKTIGATAPAPSVQFKWNFEEIYKGPGLDGKMWLGVLGNHDYGGYKFDSAWDQAISYTWHPGSGRWMTPAQYWRARVIYPSFSVDYFFVDTNVWDTGAPGGDTSHNICNNVHNKKDAGCGFEGPHSIADCPFWFAKLWEEQGHWLRKHLAASPADWQIVVTHFPPTWGVDFWTDICERYGVDVMLTGHSHNQELHHEPAETNFLHPTAWVVSGGGGGITSEATPTVNGDDNQYGFFELSLSRHQIEILGFSHGGKLMLKTIVNQRHPHHK